jgi:hypothetical protein
MSEWLLLAGGGIRPVVTVDGELVTPAEAQRRTVIRCGCGRPVAAGCQSCGSRECVARLWVVAA